MSSEQNCRNCGTALAPGARFCRQCGHPSTSFDPGSVTEGTTRILETAQPPAGSQPAYVPPTAGPVGAPNTGYIPSRAPETAGLSKKGGPLKWFIVIGLCIIVIGMISVLGAAAFFFRHKRAVTVPPVPKPVAGVVEAPQPPGAPPPPPPVIAEGEGVDAGTFREYVYPGAKVTMHIDGDDGNGMLQMNTTDPPSKVKDWYKSKFNAKSPIDLAGGVGILVGDNIKAVITPSGEGTNIILTKGES